MEAFFSVVDLDGVFAHIPEFSRVGTETVPLTGALGRILAGDLHADADLPPFSRSTMDGYAVRASTTFGASEGNPAYLNVAGAIAMGESSDFSLGPGECARIATGGMLPGGADAVVMIEHTERLDERDVGGTIEVYRSVAPGRHVIQRGEDVQNGAVLLAGGRRLRSQEIGLLAAFGFESVPVHRRPVIGILSTGDEVVSIGENPGPGQIRDINTHTLSGLIREAGGDPQSFGIVTDDYKNLRSGVEKALAVSDMVLVSGGSSVGTRDFTIDVFSDLPESAILVHGISISPGKPTILARIGGRAVWGLPGHVVSAMVVFSQVVRPFIDHVSGTASAEGRPIRRIQARLSRNIASAQGRIDFIRVRLTEREGEVRAEPILGKSGLIHTMVKADGLVAVGMNTEGLDRDAVVSVIPV